MADDNSKVEIGFGIGQVLSVRLGESDLRELRQAVEADKGWYDVKVQEGTVALNLATVVFIRVTDAARGVGFSN